MRRSLPTTHSHDAFQICFDCDEIRTDWIPYLCHRYGRGRGKVSMMLAAWIWRRNNGAYQLVCKRVVAHQRECVQRLSLALTTRASLQHCQCTISTDPYTPSPLNLGSELSLPFPSNV